MYQSIKRVRPLNKGITRAQSVGGRTYLNHPTKTATGGIKAPSSITAPVNNHAFERQPSNIPASVPKPEMRTPMENPMPSKASTTAKDKWMSRKY